MTTTYFPVVSGNHRYHSTVVPPATRDKSIKIFGQLYDAGDLNDAHLALLGSRCSLVLNAFVDRATNQKIKAEDPSVLTILYGSSYFNFGTPYWTAANQAEVDALDDIYGLFTPGGDHITYEGPLYAGIPAGQGAPLMDVRKIAWQNLFATEARLWVDVSDADGFFNDTLTEDIPPFALGQPGDVFPENYTAPGWKASSLQFMDRMNQEFAGTSKLMFFNGISRAPNVTPIPNQELQAKAEGTAIEAFSIYHSLDADDGTKDWYFFKTILEDLKQAADAGKWVVMEVYGANDDEQLRMYALCSFLMAQTDKTFFYFTRNDEAAIFRWRDEWDLSIGEPLGDYYVLANGVYARQFAKALVLVNPTASAVAGPVSMPAFSGTILSGHILSSN